MTFKETGQLRLGQTTRSIGEILQPAKINRRRLLVICLAVFVVATGVRLLHWQNNWLTIDNLMNKTAARYQEEAQFLTNRDFTSFVRGRSQEPDTGMLIHTPGYPILVAAVHAITRNSNVALRLVHIASGAATAVLVLLITVELLPVGAALLAGLFTAISPQLSYYSLVLLPDSIIGVTVLLGIYLLVRARRRPNHLMIIGAGVCIGISCWLRANVLLLAPFLCLFIPLLFPREKWLRYAALLVTAAVLMVMPITIRNTLVFKSFIPLTLGTGVNLMEGIADYDPGRRFGMEQHDHKVAQQEAVLHNRPDYAEDLYRPDGVLRERLRVGRALAVIKGNKIWFMSVMARRAGKMLTYEPVSIISAESAVSHPLDIERAELAWCSDSGPPREFVSPPVQLRRNSDYLLNVPLKPDDGRLSINIVRLDNGKTLGSAMAPDSLDEAAPRVGGFTVLRLPFVNTNADQISVAVVDAGEGTRTIQIGTLELYRLGPASYLWTKYPRMLVKTLQKFFTTRWMLPLTLIGVVLLALARRCDGLAIACAVPLYFLITHAPLHLELRYILPIHYFWAILVATSLYFISITAGHLFFGAKRALKLRKVN